MRFISIILCVLSIYVFMASAVATSFEKFHSHQKDIQLKEAIDLGLIPELVTVNGIYGEDKHGLIEFRIEKPDMIGECKVSFGTIYLFANGTGVTEYMMTDYGSNNKRYFSSRISPRVITEVSINIGCKQQFDEEHNHAHTNIFKFKVDLNAL